MDTPTLIGLVAGALTTGAFLPQVIKTWRTRATRDLSLGTFALQGSAVTFWVVYGFIIGELPLILWNVITAALVLVIILFILKYSRTVSAPVVITTLSAVAALGIVALILEAEIIGYAASNLGLAAFLPQAIKTWRTKETKDIALGMYIVFWFGVVLWLAYGVLLKDPPVVIVNTVVLSLASAILFLKIRHG